MRCGNIGASPARADQCPWTWFHSDPTRATALTRLRAEAGGIADLSLLRCLDVILWLQGCAAS